MQTQIRFIKMERSEAVETFVREQLATLAHHIPHNKEAHFHVWLENLNGQSEKRKKGFRCAIEIDGLTHKQHYAEKRDINFYKAFNHCLAALDKVLNKEKKMLSSRKRQLRWRYDSVRPRSFNLRQA